MKKKVAVIGSGIAGLSAALLLSQKHTVVLFEKEDWVGGHAHTVDVNFGDAVISPDTGFMVFNLQGYPELAKLLNHLEVKAKISDMSFSVSLNDRSFEFSSSNLFADWHHLFRPSFFRFLLEIPRFNKLAKKALDTDIDELITIGEFLDVHKFSSAFSEQYLYPMASLIWSAPPRVAATFPLSMILTFLNNHNLLSISPGLHWRSVEGGSREYVKKIINSIESQGGSVLTSTAVKQVIRTEQEVTIIHSSGEQQFDAVVMATHADDTLKLLKEPTKKERDVLDKFKYQKNRVVLHSDDSFMPKRKGAWAAWNFCDVKAGDHENEVSLTYNMNILNGIDKQYPLFVTINPAFEPQKESIHGDFVYSHPIHSVDMSQAQTRLATIQGDNRTYFCGAYFGYGFHEDGLVSGIEVAKLLGVTPQW